MRKNKHPGSGFTLIELLLVVAIIGAIAAIAIPTYNNYIRSARTNPVQQNVQQLAIAEDSNFYERNAYVAGSYSNGAFSGDLATLGWRPLDDDRKANYTVTACAGGNIATCYTITVTSVDDGTVTATLTRNRNNGV